MSYRIFLSHAWADRWLAEQIAQRIGRDCGASVFIDAFDIKKGDDIEDRIFQNMRLVDELVVLLTPWGLDRNWLWVEIGAARAHDRRIVPILYQVTLSGLDERGGSTFLRAKNVVDINELETYLTELKARVKEREGG
ncbi:MAG: toll/interleukin-1 receptor domain-containing protein [Propylenella sp.]